VYEETNRFRRSEQLAPLETSRELDAAAQAYARFMAKTGKYGHTADGRQPAERASAHGYDYCIVSENLAYLYRSAGYDAASLAADMVEGWKSSPEHRKSMLDRDVTQSGVGIARDEKGSYYGVQMFGRPKASAIRFNVQNRAARAIEYRMGERRFSLPPRAERSHSVCRSLGIAIGSFSARPSDGATYVVSDGLEVSVQR
jgi:hypothetical protein